MAEPGKICTGCKEWKPLSEFHKDRAKADGLTYQCKVCVAARVKAYREANREEILAKQKARYGANRKETLAKQKAYREANPEKVAARKKAWHEANREKVAAYYKVYREANPERVAAQQKAWHEANREEILAKKKAYREANREEIAAQRKAYREANREEVNARQRAYYKADPDKAIECAARRRARKAGAEGSHTRAEFRALCELFGQVCLCCETSHEESPLTVDHVVPLSKGGSNDISNIQPLCGYCNDSKGTKTIDYRGASVCSG